MQWLLQPTGDPSKCCECRDAPAQACCTDHSIVDLVWSNGVIGQLNKIDLSFQNGHFFQNREFGALDLVVPSSCKEHPVQVKVKGMLYPQSAGMAGGDGIPITVVGRVVLKLRVGGVEKVMDVVGFNYIGKPEKALYALYRVDLAALDLLPGNNEGSLGIHVEVRATDCPWSPGAIINVEAYPAHPPP